MAQDPNPYAPPKSPVAEHSQGPSLYPDAGLWRRFFNNTIDGIGVQLAVVPVAAVIATVSPEALESVWAVYGLSLLTMLAYFATTEYYFGLTLGKLITGTRVVSETGEPLELAGVL